MLIIVTVSMFVYYNDCAGMSVESSLSCVIFKGFINLKLKATTVEQVMEPVVYRSFFV